MRFLLISVAMATFVFLVLPILVVFPLSFSSSLYLQFPPSGFSLQWYARFFETTMWTEAALLSVQVALGTMVCTLLLGILAAFGLVRGSFKGKGVLLIFLITPIIIPYIITGIAIYFLFSKLGLVGNPIGLLVAHTLLSIPKVVIIIAAALKGFDRGLERASMSLGAGPFTTFCRVTFPVIRPAVFTAGLFAFLTSFDELIITMFIAGPTAVTLPKQLWNSVQTEIDPTIAAVSSLMVSISILILLAIVFLRRRSGSIKVPVT